MLAGFGVVVVLRLAEAVGAVMWVLVVVALNSHMAFSIPGFSAEQTCSSQGKEIVAALPRKKAGSTWVYRCVKPN